MTDFNQTVTAVSEGRLKARDLVQAALDRALDPKIKDLNIFTEVLSQPALAQAADIDRRQQAGAGLGSLAGIPFVVKDNFLVAGTLTTAAVPFLNNFQAPYTGTCVQRLLDQDAVLIGKTNLDSFAHGTTTENSCFGPTKNPLDPARVPGGSSGGSAAAVAAGVCGLALGTDTGGSVRLPAAFCGLVGYKPSYGCLSRYGLVAMASSTDCPAVIGQNVAGVGHLSRLMSGRDQFDQTSWDPEPDFWQRQLPKPVTIGLISQFQAGLSPPVAEAQDQAGQQLAASRQIRLVEVSLPSISLALAGYYILVSAEISSNLSRYSGWLYGRTDDQQPELAEANRAAGFLDENKRRIILGTYVLSAGHYQAYYHKAQQLRTRLIAEFERAFDQVDFLVCPTAASGPFELGSKLKPVDLYQTDLMTVPASLAGLPAVSLPLPGSEPAGLQLIGRFGQDDLLLEAAGLLETLIGPESN